MKNELEILRRALVREKLARKEAERILENKATALFYSNKALAEINESLEQELQKRTDKIREIAKFPDQNPSPVMRFDFNGNCLFSNKAAQDILDDFKTNQGNFEYFRNLIDKCSKSNEIEVDQIETDCKIFEITLTPFVEEGYVNCYGIDATARVQAEIKKRKSEEKYKRLIEVAEDIIYETDKEGHFIYVNPKAISISGFTSDELKGSSFLSLIRSDYKDLALNFYRKQVVEGIENTYYEFPIVNKSGDEIWIGQNAQLIYQDGESIGFMAFARDITQRILAQNELKSSEEKYRGILENLELGMLEVDNNGIAIKAYPWFCKLTGYEESELVGKEVDKILIDEENRQIMNDQHEKRKEGIPGVYEIELIRKDKSRVSVLVSGAPFYNDRGEKIGSIGVHWDISEKKRNEKRLQKAIATAEEALEVKQNFLANMSHEIRTPMNAIIGLSNLLSETLVDDKAREYNAAIAISARNLITIINDILDFSKIESGKFELELIPFELSGVIDYLRSLFKLKADEKSIKLEFDTQLCPQNNFIGDETRIVQVLTNLLSNALKFTSNGSVSVVFVYKSEQLNVKVIDTGKGIDNSRIKQVFNPFRQEDEGIARKYGGTGLGLSITKSLVDLMGGEISVESKVDAGTIFTVILPLKTTKKAPKRIRREDNLFNKGINVPNLNIEVLLVEDNAINAFMAKSIIEKWKCTVTHVENGEEAIEALNKGSYDIVLMDVQMPILNGIQATHKIREDLKSTVPIIALTANAIKGEKEKCLKAGMDAYLSKPFSPIELHNLMSELVQFSIQKKNEDNKNDIDTSKNEDKNQYSFLKLDKLKVVGAGSETFINEMLDIFLETSPNILALMKDGYNSKKINELNTHAHKLKPTIDYMSTKSMSDDIRYIESLKSSSEIDNKRVEGFFHDLESLIQEASQYRK